MSTETDGTRQRVDTIIYTLIHPCMQVRMYTITKDMITQETINKLPKTYAAFYNEASEETKKRIHQSIEVAGKVEGLSLSLVMVAKGAVKAEMDKQKAASKMDKQKAASKTDKKAELISAVSQMDFQQVREMGYETVSVKFAVGEEGEAHVVTATGSKKTVPELGQLIAKYQAKQTGFSQQLCLHEESKVYAKAKRDRKAMEWRILILVDGRWDTHYTETLR